MMGERTRRRRARQKQEMTQDFKRRLHFECGIWLQALKLGCKKRLITQEEKNVCVRAAHNLNDVCVGTA